MTTEVPMGIGPDEARCLCRWIMTITEQARKDLIEECAAKCPPGKNKRLNQNADEAGMLRRAA